jgi:hypothetical protein
MTLDGHSRCALRRNGGAPPPASWTFAPLQGISKGIWGFEMLSMRQYDHVPLFRFLMLVTAGSAEGR